MAPPSRRRSVVTACPASFSPVRALLKLIARMFNRSTDPELGTHSHPSSPWLPVLEAEVPSPPSSLVTPAYLEPPGITTQSALPRPERVSGLPADPPSAAPSLLQALGAALHGMLPGSSLPASSWVSPTWTLLQEPGDLGWKESEAWERPCSQFFPARKGAMFPPRGACMVAPSTAAGIAVSLTCLGGPSSCSCSCQGPGLGN